MITGYSSDRPAGTAFAALFFAYMTAAAFGNWMIVLPGVPITIWPPNGVILAMLLTQPRQTWLWWLLVGAVGELSANAIWFHNPLVWAFGYIAANAAAVTAAALLLAPYFGAPIRRLTTLQQVLAFLVFGVGVAPAISATLGSTIDAVVGKNAFLTTWPLWWLGDATGILIATPLTLAGVHVLQRGSWPTAAQALEAAAIAVVLAGLSVWELAWGYNFAFLLPLPILWAALRFEFLGATLAVLGLTVAIALHAQDAYSAQLLTSDLTIQHARMQTLLIVAASTGLIVAAISSQQRQAVSDLLHVNSELEARVTERTREIELAEQRFRATFQNAGVGISIVDAGGVMMRVNESLAQMLGYAVEEMEGKSIDLFTHPEDLPLGKAAWSRLQSGADDEYDIEKRYIDKHGAALWGHTTVSCVRTADGRISYLIKIIQDITARKQSDEAREILTREVNHRSKNLLTIIQVIARQTAAKSLDDFVNTFSKRLRALAANQDLLVNNEWRPIEITALVHSQVEHFGTIGSRILLTGPTVTLSPSTAQTLSMALHELATNAAKYGGLSNDTGRVDITWAVEEGDFQMTWRESGGPPVSAPNKLGFGTTVLETMTASNLLGEVDIDYAADGLVWQLRCPLSALCDMSG